MKALADKKVLMIIAHVNFQDEEYQAPREILEGHGASVTVASSALMLPKENSAQRSSRTF